MKQREDIKCEVRGLITTSDFNDIRPLLERDWGRLHQTPELMIFFKSRGDFRLKINSSGIYLCQKITVDKISKSKREVELKLSLINTEKVVRFLSVMGYHRGFFSYCYKFQSKKGKRIISVKFGTKIGDFIEFEEIISSGADIQKIYGSLKFLFQKYGLQAWDNDVYKKIVSESWVHRMEESLITKSKLHPLIKKVLEEIRSGNNHNFRTISIAGLLKKKSNDYTSLAYRYEKLTSENLLSKKPGKVENYNLKVSIVIPTYNNSKSLAWILESIADQVIHPQQKKLIEVIVVDDGSNEDTEKVVRNIKLGMTLRYIRQNHLGRVYARNLGAFVARGEVLIFLDSDVVLEKHFINEHIKHHYYLDRIVLVSFKQNIKDNAYKRNKKNKSALRIDITNDFRFIKTVKKDWLRMHRHVRNIELRTVKILEETNNFKDFGHSRVVGVWDLPTMVVTNAVSLKKISFESIGGFNLQFKGWGMEDTFLGACLIATGHYILPCFSTGILHIEHVARSGSLKKKIREFNQNVLVYLDLINRPAREIFKNYYLPKF